MAQNTKKNAIQEILNKEGSKSSKMLKLYNAGLGIREIADLMNVRYNFVYNVVSNECRKSGTEVRVNQNKGAVKNSIIKLIEAGKTNVEISRELQTNYNYIFKVRKEYEASKA